VQLSHSFTGQITRRVGTTVNFGAWDAVFVLARCQSQTSRLWAATGQAALESCRVLVLSGSATSTSVLKNLVLPGIGHFTILDPVVTSGADAGNNFFLDGPSSIGKHRASEAVALLCELNDGVDGRADTRSVQDVLAQDPNFFLSFTLVIAHNLPTASLDKLSTLLWTNESAPTLIVVRSAGFVSEFFIQFLEHDSKRAPYALSLQRLIHDQ
jgi:amyloid beta precursor protein binding protein 1